ncbi:hypothetical protein C2S51_037590 [Perilla frutescens var. frutescens]|nr:hypothetical protein C2S51_037590 [Perilla frutescens var. frutescens]
MAPKLVFVPLLLPLLLIVSISIAEADGGLHLMNETLEWEPEIIEDEGLQRRSLYWHSVAPPKRYYISYGALSANRVPCPPRSGRSYYTHNCFKARGPVHPYTRGCSAITRCRR